MPTKQQRGNGSFDEFIRDCLTMRVRCKLFSIEVIDALTDLLILRSIPALIRSDNGPEFFGGTAYTWIAAIGLNSAYIEPGSPWGNGYVESFNARFRNKPINGEILHTLRDAQILIEDQCTHYNTQRPHNALGYRPPALENTVRIDQRPTMD